MTNVHSGASPVLTRPAMLIANRLHQVDGDTPEEKLAKLNECNCCDRHQTNKPKTYSPWLECKSNGMMWHESFVQCECDCRHMARQICRSCSEESTETEGKQENTWVDKTSTGITDTVM